MKRPVCYVMVGVAGSGKSYLAESIGAPIVSSDAIRKELYGDENDQSHNNEVFNEVHGRIRRYLLNGESCVYDATNLSRKRRMSFLKQLPAEVEKVAILAATELEVILEQNAARERKVPEDVIMRMYRNLSVPRVSEGWDSIRMIAHPKNKMTLEDYLYAAYGVDHDNPHHSANIFDHMIEAEQLAYIYATDECMSNYDRNLAHFAARYHDIGKPAVKSRMLYSGKEDSHSHYYNHAEVGAYMVACCAKQFVGEKQQDFLRELIVLIQHHMGAFENNEHWMDDFERYYGRDLRLVLNIVHEADLNAH